jgi:hypothetical protein
VFFFNPSRKILLNPITRFNITWVTETESFNNSRINQTEKGTKVYGMKHKTTEFIAIIFSVKENKGLDFRQKSFPGRVVKNHYLNILEEPV